MIARLLGSGFVFFLAVWPATATKYNIADSTGTLSIEGFIETNGKTGVLSDSDIVSWSLTITGHGAPITLDKGNSSFRIGGRALSATDKSFIFDYSEHLPYYDHEQFPGTPIYVPRSWLGFFFDPDAQAAITWWSADPKAPQILGSPGFSISIARPDLYLDIWQFVGRTGIKTIATVP